MHLSLEQLMEADQFNQEWFHLIKASGR
jgi:hypothetical protein